MTNRSGALRRTFLLLAAFSLLVSACGGGGNDASTAPEPFTLSTSTIQFDSTHSSQTVTATLIDHPYGTPLYFNTVITGNAVDSVGYFFPGTTAVTRIAEVRAASNRGPGTYTSTITVTACTTDAQCTSGIIGKPQSLNVTYTVTYALISPFPTSLAYTIFPNSVDGDFVKTLQFVANAPWSISSSLAALSVSPSSSNTTTSGALTITLSRAAIAGLPTGTTEAQLVFRSAGNDPINIPVLIDVHRARAFYAAPRVQVSGGPGDITTLLWGDDLSVPAVQGNLSARYNEIPETVGFASGQTRYRSVRPALPAGSYAMHLLTTAGIDAAQPSLKIIVIDPLTLPAKAIAYPDGRARRVSDLHFDAETHALVVGVQYPGGAESDSQILRYTWNGSWSSAGIRSQPYLAQLAPRIDGGWLVTALLNNGRDDGLVMCNQDFTSCTNRKVDSPANTRLTAIGMLGDGKPLMLSRARGDVSGINAVQRYSLLQDTFLPTDYGDLYGAIAASSDDGTHVAIGSHPPGPADSSIPSLVLWNADYDRFDGWVTTPTLAAVNRLAIDGRATRIVVNGSQVYETVFMSLLGTLPVTTLATALNRSGSRAYTWDANGTVRTFDVQNGPVTAAGSFVEIAPAITPAGNPGAGIDGLDMRMAMSPDERILFMAGSAGIVVVPVGQ